MKHRKTELGKEAFKGRNVTLSMPQRSALIMFDGTKEDAAILQALSVMGLKSDDIDFLVQSGLIEVANGAQATAPMLTPVASAGAAAVEATSASPNGAARTLSDQELYQRAYPIATKLTSGLGLRGFRLNMSVEGASGFKDLLALAPKIQAAVGDEKFAELARALKA
jgi:uncharacterized membrane protein